MSKPTLLEQPTQPTETPPTAPAAEQPKVAHSEALAELARGWIEPPRPARTESATQPGQSPRGWFDRD
ncbi:MAG: hypothetical protein K1X74_17365 [Pirellulales bacterium]|nr:hypothetical protein [Pirellulales bacterium]